MNKESMLILVSMSQTMSTLWPAPIEMDEIDELAYDHADENTAASRWAICSGIIRQMIEQTTGCGVEIVIGKNTDLGVILTRGDSDKNVQPLFNVLNAISKSIKSNDTANPEFAFREICKFFKSSEKFTRKHVHWFIDAETFVEMSPSIINQELAGPVTVHVIGELRTLHDSYESTKRVGTLLEECGVEVQFLVCRADLQELRKEIRSVRRFRMSEIEVNCFVGPMETKLKLIQQHEVGKVTWNVSTLSFLGFIAESELCRLGVFGQKTITECLISVAQTDTVGNEIFWSLANHLLTEKRPLVALFQCYDQVEFREFCIMVAHNAGPGAINISFARSEILTTQLLEHSLELVDDITANQSSPPPVEIYPPIAPLDPRSMKRRLSQIETIAALEERKQKFDEFSSEYSLLHLDSFFSKFTSTWKKEFIENPEKIEKNNNDNSS